MKNKTLILFSFILIAGLLLSACGGSGGDTSGGSSATEAPTQAPADGGNATSNTPVASEAPTMIDPANATGDDAKTAAETYETLVVVKDGNIAPGLAESYSVSDDGLDYIFNLRTDAKFSDGTAVTADAVVANFNRWFDPKDALRGKGDFSAWKSAFGGFKGETDADGKAKSQYDGIEKVDEHTVIVHLNTPDAEFLGKIADGAFAIVSPDVLKTFAK
jgi:peptide/nickel transport system substrate-binding protein